MFCLLSSQRADDPSPPLPDCKNITKTASAHAAMLVEAGFDYVTVDITNWPQVNPPTDIAVLRPTEVLFEEWLRLRQRGTPTPQIAVWPCSPNGANTWQYIFDHIYNNDTFSELVYRMDGKKVVFLPDNPTCYDPSEEALIRSNGGRNDVVTIRMWALFGAANYQQGSWGFFSPCTVGQGTSVTYTTSMVGVGPCAQFSSIENASVAEVSASGSYMLSQTSLPFASAGHMRGLTLQRLFEKVLAVGAPNLFMSSFNEHIGGRQAPACAANTCFNMGMQNLLSFISSLLLLLPQTKQCCFCRCLCLVRPSILFQLSRCVSCYTLSIFMLLLHSLFGAKFFQGLPQDPQRSQVWVDTYGSKSSANLCPRCAIIFILPKANFLETLSPQWKVARGCGR